MSKKSNSVLYTEETANEDKGSNQDNYKDTHKDSIDLIFMDIQMPRMSGHEAAKQIRSIESDDSHIPIIALTAHGLADERDKLIASGINDYVGKPISQPQLLQVLQKWLGRTSTTPQLTALSEANLHELGLKDTDAASSHTDASTDTDTQTFSEWPLGATTSTYPVSKSARHRCQRAAKNNATIITQKIP